MWQRCFPQWSIQVIACAGFAFLSACSSDNQKSASVSHQTAIQVVDDDGYTVQLAKPAKRIMTLAPHATELVYEIGAGQQVIATTRFSNYPKEALNLPTVGDVHQLDIEKIISLKPDLIVLWPSGSTAKQMALLAETGIPIYRSNPQKLQDIPESMMKLGQLAGHDNEGKKAAEQWQNQYNAIRRKYSGKTPLSVFYQVFDQPIYTIGGKQVINEAIDVCGGRNIFNDIQMPSPTVALETVIGRNPDVIISSGGTSGGQGLGLWQGIPSMKAVKAHNLYSIPPDLISRPGPRLMQGIQYLCESIEKARQKAVR